MSGGPGDRAGRCAMRDKGFHPCHRLGSKTLKGDRPKCGALLHGPTGMPLCVAEHACAPACKARCEACLRSAHAWATAVAWPSPAPGLRKDGALPTGGGGGGGAGGGGALSQAQALAEEADDAARRLGEACPQLALGFPYSPETCGCRLRACWGAGWGPAGADCLGLRRARRPGGTPHTHQMARMP